MDKNGPFEGFLVVEKDVRGNVVVLAGKVDCWEFCDVGLIEDWVDVLETCELVDKLDCWVKIDDAVAKLCELVTE